MSGTRSRSRKEQAIDAIIVSHGQPSHAQAGEVHLRALAQRVREFLPDWQIRSATLAAPGRLEHALDAAGPQPIVLPVFMAEGWFTKTALAGRLKNTGARQLPALGVHPDLPALTARLLQTAANHAGWEAHGYEVLLAAHGSATGSAAGRCSLDFAQAMASWLPSVRIDVGFLEQAPHLEEVARGRGLRTLALPFFAGTGGHVRDDVPQALDRAEFQGLRMEPLGNAHFIPELIAHALEHAAHRMLAA
jgi:sirohydrochlorin ferrochelatase